MCVSWIGEATLGEAFTEVIRYSNSANYHNHTGLYIAVSSVEVSYSFINRNFLSFEYNSKRLDKGKKGSYLPILSKVRLTLKLRR